MFHTWIREAMTMGHKALKAMRSEPSIGEVLQPTTGETPAKPAHPEVPEEDRVMLTTRQTLEFNELQEWGLKEDPLDRDQDIWLGPRQRAMLDRSVRAVRNHEILVGVGEVGAGKTQNLRAFLDVVSKRTDVRVITPASLDRSGLTKGALASAVCRGLGEQLNVPSTMEDRSERARQLMDLAAQNNIHPVLVIDEAHDLSVEGLIAVKRLWDTGQLVHPLAVLLFGQGRSVWTARTGQSSTRDLAFRLNRDVRLRELGQRARVIYFEPYTAEEIQAYCAFRWSKVGARVEDHITPDVYAVLAAAPALAYPLSINNLMALAMRQARSLGDTRVEAEHMKLVLGVQ